MNTLPIVVREMRVASRKPWVYWVRSAVGLAAIGVWLLISSSGPPQASAAVKGMLALNSLSAVAMVLVLASGMFLTADRISQEKRDGTLGLLFLTPLRAHDVVLGKLAASAGVAFLALLAFAPITCLPLLTGGVTWAETGRIFVVLMLSLALSLGVGIFISVRQIEARQAFASTLLTLLAICGIPLIAWFVMEVVFKRPVPDHWLCQISPIYALTFAFERNYNRYSGTLYWQSVAFVAFIALALIVLACRMLGRRWRDHAEPKATPIKVHRLREENRRPPLPREIPGPDLYGWLSYRGSAFGGAVRLFVAVTAAFLLVMLALSSTNNVRQGGFMLAMLSAFVLHLVVKATFALEATRPVHEDTRSGAMELLLATPLSERDIIRGQLRTSRRSWGGAVAFLTLINLVLELSIFVLYDHLHMRRVAPVFSTFFLGGILLLHADLHAMSWAAIWNAARAPTHLAAAFHTIKQVLGIPWLLFPVCFFVATQARNGNVVEKRMLGLMCLWVVIGLALDAYVISKNRSRLRAHFRGAVAGELK